MTTSVTRSCFTKQHQNCKTRNPGGIQLPLVTKIDFFGLRSALSWDRRSQTTSLQEAQLMLTNPHDTVRGQSKSPNMVPFLLMCYNNFVSKRYLRYSTSKMSWHWNPAPRSLKVIGTDTDRSATYDFLLTLHINREPISYHYRDKRRFRSKIANFSHPRAFNAPAEGVPLWIGYRRKDSKTKMIMLPEGKKVLR